MLSSLSTSITLILLSSQLVQAIYFTKPQTSTTWSIAEGQTMTWFHQSGDATVGNIVLKSVADSTQVTLATSISLISPTSFTFPPEISLSSSSNSYLLLIVNTANPKTIYSSVGPFTILTLSSSSSSSSITNNDSPDVGSSSSGSIISTIPLPSPVLPHLPLSSLLVETGTASMQGTEGSPQMTATNPAVSTATSSMSGMITSFVSSSSSSSSTISSTGTGTITSLALGSGNLTAASAKSTSATSSASSWQVLRGSTRWVVGALWLMMVMNL